MLRVVLTVCCVCVACELHGRAMQHNHHTSKAQRLPHKRAACVPKCCTCHTSTIGFFYPICNSDCCHDILHPFSYCQPMSRAYEKVVLAETVTMPFVSVRVLQKKQPSDRTVDSSVGSPAPPNFKVVSFGLSPSAFRKNSHSS